MHFMNTANSSRFTGAADFFSFCPSKHLDELAVFKSTRIRNNSILQVHKEIWQMIVQPPQYRTIFVMVVRIHEPEVEHLQKLGKIS